MQIVTSPRYGDPGAGLAIAIREYRSGVPRSGIILSAWQTRSVNPQIRPGRRIFEVDYMSSK